MGTFCCMYAKSLLAPAPHLCRGLQLPVLLTSLPPLGLSTSASDSSSFTSCGLASQREPTRVLLFRARSHMSQDHRSQSRRGRPWSTCRLKLLLYGLGKWARGSCLRSHCPLGVLGPLGPKAQNEGVTQTWQHNAFPLKQGFCYRNLMQPGPQIHVEYLLGGVSSQVPLPGASSLNSQAKTQGMTTWALISSPPFSHLLSHLCASVWTRGIYFKLGATIQNSLIYLVAQIVPALAVRSFLLAPASL